MAGRTKPRAGRPRRGIVAVVTAVVLVVVLALIAFAVDIGAVAVSRTQLQSAADAAALAAAQQFGKSDGLVRDAARRLARDNTSADFVLSDQQIEFGYWDIAASTFTPAGEQVNAVRVTVRRDGTTNARTSLFFGRIFGRADVGVQASSIAMANPRDIAIVVDLSGSMNDDTEPCWAFDEISSRYGSGTAEAVMQRIYHDFGLGQFPGTLQYIGQPLGVEPDSYAYAEMTKDDGPLAGPSIPSQYRIQSHDDESTRKQKAYRWIIDYQLQALMPAALPTPNSANAASYAFWEQYLDYVLIGRMIWTEEEEEEDPPPPESNPPGDPPSSPPGNPPPPPPPPRGGGAAVERPATGQWAALGRGNEFSAAAIPGLARSLLTLNATTSLWGPLTLGPLVPGQSGSGPKGKPPLNRGEIPPNQHEDRIYSSKFNNPNTFTYEGANVGAAYPWRNYVGPRTYIQFLLDYGRDGRVAGQLTPLSRDYPSPRTPDTVRGLTFEFPPAEQPMHACRRAIIAALDTIQQRNTLIPNPAHRDHVAIITFDSKQNGATVRYGLGADYGAAMQACVDLQATTDDGYTTTTDSGLALANSVLANQGRARATKIVVLLTDGAPNDWITDSRDISAWVNAHNATGDFYNNEGWWLDAALVQAHSMKLQGYAVWPVGIGLGTVYDFMDRMARLGGTADGQGRSKRGSGDPANYEDRLVEIFDAIFQTQKVVLVD